MSKHPYSYPAWALKFRTPGTELRHQGDKIYLYAYKTIYDPVRKKPKKISSQYLGRITESQGLIQNQKQLLRDKLPDKFEVALGPIRELGISSYILAHFAEQIEKLKEIFGQDKAHIICLAALCRLAFQSPIKRMPFLMANSWLSEAFGGKHYSDKAISSHLKSIGMSRAMVTSYMKCLIMDDEFILVDTTHILSKSEHIILSHKGYNAQMDYNPQFNLMYLFGQQCKMPVFYRLHPGNIKEVSALKLTIEESGIKKATIIGDKGFYSEANMQMLDDASLQYILPLRRDNKLIDYGTIKDNSIKTTNQYFMHESRIIWFVSVPIAQHKMLHLFLDDFLKQKEERDYLSRIQSHPEDYSIEIFNQRYFRFGTFAVIENLENKPAHQIYTYYKTRMNVESMFDNLKNVIDVDSTYMQDENTLQGWMFVNHIALQWYHHMYQKIAEQGLTSKYSVKDLLMLLQNIRKVKINNQWFDSEITKDTKKIFDKLKI